MVGHYMECFAVDLGMGLGRILDMVVCDPPGMAPSMAMAT